MEVNFYEVKIRILREVTVGIDLNKRHVVSGVWINLSKQNHLSRLNKTLF